MTYLAKVDSRQENYVFREHLAFIHHFPPDNASEMLVRIAVLNITIALTNFYQFNKKVADKSPMIKSVTHKEKVFVLSQAHVVVL